MSHEQATSHPPPSAKPSTIAIVGLFRFQIASIALSLNNSLISSEPFPTNSVMSAPATNACGLALFPSGGGLGLAPVITTHLIESFSSAHLHISLMLDVTS